MIPTVTWLSDVLRPTLERVLSRSNMWRVDQMSDVVILFLYLHTQTQTENLELRLNRLGRFYRLNSCQLFRFV